MERRVNGGRILAGEETFGGWMVPQRQLRKQRNQRKKGEISSDTILGGQHIQMRSLLDLGQQSRYAALNGLLQVELGEDVLEGIDAVILDEVGPRNGEARNPAVEHDRVRGKQKKPNAKVQHARALEIRDGSSSRRVMGQSSDGKGKGIAREGLGDSNQAVIMQSRGPVSPKQFHPASLSQGDRETGGESSRHNVQGPHACHLHGKLVASEAMHVGSSQHNGASQSVRLPTIPKDVADPMQMDPSSLTSSLAQEQRTEGGGHPPKLPDPLSATQLMQFYASSLSKEELASLMGMHLEHQHRV